MLNIWYYSIELPVWGERGRQAPPIILTIMMFSMLMITYIAAYLTPLTPFFFVSFLLPLNTIRAIPIFICAVLDVLVAVHTDAFQDKFFLLYHFFF